MGGMATGWAPELRLHETDDGGCRLTLAGLTHGTGPTLQEAADDLIERLLRIILFVSTDRRPLARGQGPPDPRMTAFVTELAEIARRGDDIRDRVFGGASAPDDFAV